MNVLRYLRNECMELELAFRPTPIPPEENESQRERRRANDKEQLIQEFSQVLDRSGEIINTSKFYRDMVNRERKASTAIFPGVAIPHVRSMQCRSFIMGFCRMREGIDFVSLDGQPTRVFFLLSSPPYEDKIYLRVYRQIAAMLQHDWVLGALLDAEDATEVLNVLRGHLGS